MRISPVLLALFTALSIPACAASFDERTPDQRSLEALEQRAIQAQPKEQCFLYAELVHQMVEYSAHQYAEGDVDKATGLLKRAQELTHKLRAALVGKDKKLKDAQILLRHTAFRLNEWLHSSSSEDRPVLEQTLSQLNEAQTETMLAVFKR